MNVGLELSALPTDHREQEGIVGDAIVWKLLKSKFWWFCFSGLANTSECWRTVLLERAWKLHTSPSTPAYIPYKSSMAVSELYSYDKLRTLSPFLSSVSHSNKLLKLGKGSWQPPVYSWLIRSTGDSYHLQLAFRAGAVWVWALNLWGLPNSCGLVLELEPRTTGQYAENQRTGSWCWKTPQISFVFFLTIYHLPYCRMLGPCYSDQQYQIHLGAW